MSDAINDAYRPDNKPKGMGWWPIEKQKEYVQKIFDRGDRDDWILFFMFWNNMMTRYELIEQLKEHHPEELKRMGYEEDMGQGKLL
jgi:hypothetical protein